jgi:hypothetical protein
MKSKQQKHTAKDAKFREDREKAKPFVSPQLRAARWLGPTQRPLLFRALRGFCFFASFALCFCLWSPAF